MSHQSYLRIVTITVFSAFFCLGSIIVTKVWTKPAGTTYYIAKNQQPATSYALGPGDKVLFERGGRWTGTHIAFYCSGASGDSCRIGAYGTGADPVITGRTTVPGFNIAGNWTAVHGDSVWRMPLTLYSSYRLYFSRSGLYTGVEGDRAYLGSQNSLLVDSVNRYRNYATDNSLDYALYVYSPGMPPSSYYSNIEYAGPTSTLEVDYNYWVVEGLDIQGGSVATLDCIYASNFSIRNNKIGWDAAHSGVSFNGAKNGLVEYNEIDAGDRKADRPHLFQGGIGDAVYVGIGAHNLAVRRNYIHDWGHSGFEILTVGHTSPQPEHWLNGYLLSDIDVYENLVKGVHVPYMRGFALDVDTSVANRFLKRGSIRVYRNWFDSLKVQNQAACESAIIAYNIISHTFNPTVLEYADQDAGFGLFLGAYNLTSGHRMKIYGNTFVLNQSGGIKTGGNSAANYDTVGQNYIYNNVLWRNGWKGDNQTVLGHVNGVQFCNETLGTIAGSKLGPHYLKNNLLYSDWPANIYFNNHYTYPNYTKDFTYFNTLAGADMGWTITGNLYGDPLFVNLAAGNFALGTGSPAIGAGLNLSAEGLPDGIKDGSLWPTAVTAAAEPTLWRIGAMMGSATVPTPQPPGTPGPTDSAAKKPFLVTTPDGKRWKYSGRWYVIRK